MYDYYAEVRRIIDGDTVDLLVDQGLDALRKLRVRMLNINAPDTWDGTEAKKAATEYLTSLLAPEGTFLPLYIFTKKDKKDGFGRYLAEMWLWGQDHTTEPSINDLMVSSGHAVWFMVEKS